MGVPDIRGSRDWLTSTLAPSGVSIGELLEESSV